LKITQALKKILPRDHGAEIPPKDPKSHYANRDFPIQGDGARQNKYMIGFYATLFAERLSPPCCLHAVFDVKT
jgi:hypothetical protein